jgi:hypothetical protein
MEDAFGTVVWVVVVAAAVVALFTLAGVGRDYEQIGGGPLDEERDPRAEREEEIAQLLEARAAHRARRGARAPADPPPPDAGLREEVRQLVLARNARRVRRGAEPLDVDAEVERQLRDLT